MDVQRKQLVPGVAALEMKGRILMGPDCLLMDKEVEHLVAQGNRLIIFDLTDVIQIDSAAVGKIVMCFTRMKKSGGDLRLAGVKGMLDGVFKMTQVHKIIAMYPTAAEAAQGF